MALSRLRAENDKPMPTLSTKKDERELINKGHSVLLASGGAHPDMVGCSLCMGNQDQVREGATVGPPQPATSQNA